MESGRFGWFEEVSDLRDRLKQFSYVHSDLATGESLRSAVQVNKTGEVNGHKVIEGLVIDEVMTKVSTLERSEDGRYYVHDTSQKSAKWARFIAFTDGLVVLENSAMISDAFRILSQAISGSNTSIRVLGFNVEKIYHDFSGHWMDEIEGRKGHWHGGTLYGEGLETDDAVGKELEKSTKNRVGFYTDYFARDRTKVAVTKDGSVMIWAGVKRDDFLKYVLDELSAYMIR
jgi:hypothetical protein